MPRVTHLPAHTSTVRIRDFYSEGGDELIPLRPGIYVWTIDIADWLIADKPTIQARVANALRAVGPVRDKEVGPYARVWIQDSRKAIRPERQLVLHDRLNAGGPFGDWVAQISTAVQRPLYIGMANSLRGRISEHLTGKTPLRGKAKELNLEMLNLAVTWWAAPLDDAAQSDDHVDDEPDLDLAPLDDLTPEDEVTGIDPVMDTQLKAVESLLIRMAMPMLNARQD